MLPNCGSLVLLAAAGVTLLADEFEFALMTIQHHNGERKNIPELRTENRPAINYSRRTSGSPTVYDASRTAFLASEMNRQPHGNFAAVTGPITGGRDRAAVQLDQRSRERQSHAGRSSRAVQRSLDLGVQIKQS